MELVCSHTSLVNKGFITELKGQNVYQEQSMPCCCLFMELQQPGISKLNSHSINLGVKLLSNSVSHMKNRTA